MEKTLREVASASFTLLVNRGIITKEEFDKAIQYEFDGLYDLIMSKFDEDGYTDDKIKKNQF